MLEKNDNQLNETEAVEFLRRGLLLGTGFQLYLVAANTVDQRSSIVQRISEISGLTAQVMEGADIGTQKTLVRALLENFHILDDKQSRPILILTEIEEYAIEMPRTLSHLNMNRNELIRGFPGALLILGSSQLMARFRSEAPDTWSIRAGDMEIAPPNISKSIADMYMTHTNLSDLIYDLAERTILLVSQLENINHYMDYVELNHGIEFLGDLNHQIDSIVLKHHDRLLQLLDTINRVLVSASFYELEFASQLRLIRAAIYVFTKEPHQAIDELRVAERDLARINNIPLIQQIRLLLGFAAIQAGLNREARYAWHRYLIQGSINGEYSIQNLIERFEHPEQNERSIVNKKAWQIINSLSQELNLYLPDTLHEENFLDDISADGPNEMLDESSQE